MRLVVDVPMADVYLEGWHIVAAHTMRELSFFIRRAILSWFGGSLHCARLPPHVVYVLHL